MRLDQKKLASTELVQIKTGNGDSPCRG
jgi:hypothetical protein